MKDDFRRTTGNRLALEGEQLVLYNLATGARDLVSIADVWRHKLALSPPGKSTFWQRITRLFKNAPDGAPPVSAVWVPSGTHLILKSIPTSLQQRYGLGEEEGAIFLRPDTAEGRLRGGLRFNNGALVQLQELRAGQLVEALSLAGTQPTLYEPELQVK